MSQYCGPLSMESICGGLSMLYQGQIFLYRRQRYDLFARGIWLRVLRNLFCWDKPVNETLSEGETIIMGCL